MALPLITTVEKIRTKLGSNLARYLTRMVPDQTLSTSEKNALVDVEIEDAIRAAQQDIENKTRYFLFQRRVKTTPMDNKPDGSQPVLGTDYDAAIRAPDFVSSDFQSGTAAKINLYWKPIISVSRLAIRLTPPNDPAGNIPLEVPTRWAIVGESSVSVVPLVGTAPYALSAIMIIPNLAPNGIGGVNLLPNMVCCDFVAGLINPLGWDPYTSDPDTSCPFPNIRPLIQAVEYRACANILRDSTRLVGTPGLSSLAMDGFSQGYDKASLEAFILDYDKKADSAAAGKAAPLRFGIV